MEDGFGFQVGAPSSLSIQQSPTSSLPPRLLVPKSIYSASIPRAPHVSDYRLSIHVTLEPLYRSAGSCEHANTRIDRDPRPPSLIEYVLNNFPQFQTPFDYPTLSIMIPCYGLSWFWYQHSYRKVSLTRLPIKSSAKFTVIDSVLAN